MVLCSEASPNKLHGLVSAGCAVCLVVHGLLGHRGSRCIRSRRGFLVIDGLISTGTATGRESSRHGPDYAISGQKGIPWIDKKELTSCSGQIVSTDVESTS